MLLIKNIKYFYFKFTKIRLKTNKFNKFQRNINIYIKKIKFEICANFILINIIINYIIKSKKL